MPKYNQGKFKPRYPEKYKGNITNCVYRSGWEAKFLNWCDLNPNVLKYSSEEIVIPYVSPIDNKTHRYFVDFYIKIKHKDGTIKEYLVEIKPKKQTKPPDPNKRKTKSWLYEATTYAKNQSKWDAAKKYCQKRGWEFLVLTEDQLNV